MTNKRINLQKTNLPWSAEVEGSPVVNNVTKTTTKSAFCHVLTPKFRLYISFNHNLVEHVKLIPSDNPSIYNNP